MLEAVSFVKKPGIWVLGAIEVVDVQILDKCHYLIIERCTLRRIINLNVHLVPVENASK
jgi:hypothetical protein